VTNVHDDPWTATTLFSISLNVGTFILVSLLTRSSKSEQVAAEICSMDARARPKRQTLAVRSAADFASELTPALGAKTARSEVDLALHELQFSPEETRPYALRRLRARIEVNLSGLLGPAVAHRIVTRCLPFQPGLHGEIEDLQLIERDLDRAKPQFTGLAADLDNLRRHHRETLDKLPIGVCSMSPDDELLMWNDAMEEITDIAADRVLGSLLESVPGAWRSVLVAFHAGENDTVVKREVTLENGSSRWVNLHKTLIGEDGSGDTVILVEDVTDYQLLEAELLHNERLASIGRLAAGVAHEIGNPVTGIACLAQNLEYEDDREEIRQMAQDILKQTNRVTRIVESLMNFSHSGVAANEMEFAPVNLADCVDEAIHLLTLQREAHPVQFNNLCDRELLVRADAQRLLQVFVNLLANARDACEGFGEIHVRAAARGDSVTIDVEDNGCGIPAELQSQIFEPFFTTKDPGAGTGLGLALVHSIVEDMRGRVHLLSPLFQDTQSGTRFTIELPRASYGDVFDL